MITIVGQLAANVGTVLIVGAALALVHEAGGSLQAVGPLVIAVVLGSSGLVLGVAVRRGRGSTWSSVPRRVRPWFSWPLVVLGWLVLVEALLIVTGMAAGVK